MSFSFAPIRPRIADWRGWLPPLALALFMFIALLALGGDRGYFYRAEGDHDWGTVKNLAIAENLSPEHNFLLTTKVWRDEDGGLSYAPYGRFPVGGYVLLKLALSPFGNDLAAKLMAARVLMLMMFCGAALFACLALSRATGSRWGAHEAEPQRAEMADFDDIREMTREKPVEVFPKDAPWPWFTPMQYYLAEIYMKENLDGVCEAGVADFVVSGFRADIPNLLTPDNRFAFLYENPARRELCKARRRQLESSTPAARAVWDVYLQDGEVGYMKAPCEPRDYEARFYAYVHPVNPDDMPARFRLGGGFHSIRESTVFEYGGACIMTLRLPSYPIAAIQAGQWLPGEERLWLYKPAFGRGGAGVLRKGLPSHIIIRRTRRALRRIRPVPEPRPRNAVLPKSALRRGRCARTLLPKRPPRRRPRPARRPPRNRTRKPKLHLRPARRRRLQRQVHGDAAYARLRHCENRDGPVDTRRRTAVGRGDSC